MHLHHVAAGKHAGDAGLHVLVHDGALGAGVHLDAGLLGQLVFGDQPHAQQNGVHIKLHLSAGNGFAVGADLGHDGLFHTVLALNIHDGVGEVQGDVKVVQALHDIAGQATGVGHHFYAGQHLCTLKGHAAGHDQADVTAAEDQHPLAHQIAFHVHIALCCTGGVHAGRAGARGADGTAGALAAAHAQHDAFCLDDLVAVLLGDAVHLFVRGHFQHHGVQLHLYAGFLEHLNKAPGILRAGQLFAEAVQTKAVVDALVQNAAQFLVALQNKNVAQTAFPCLAGSSKARRATANNDQINHCSFLLPSFR